jgi:hypothetical protein
MKGAFTRERIAATAEVAHQLPVYGPDVRKHVRLEQGIGAAGETGNTGGAKEVVFLQRLRDGRNQTGLRGDVRGAFDAALKAVSYGNFAASRSSR